MEFLKCSCLSNNKQTHWSVKTSRPTASEPLLQWRAWTSSWK